MKILKNILIRVLPKEVISFLSYFIALNKYFIKKNKFTIEGNFINYKSKHTFFWYYDKTPFDLKDKNILCIAVDNFKSKICYILLYNLEDKRFKELGTSFTWNTQMWCRLFWFNKEKNLIIYNDYDNGKYISIIKNVNTNFIEKKIDLPVYDISINKDKLFSLDFSRLNTFRKWYGYGIIEDKTKNEKIPKNNGIWMHNINTWERKLILSLEEIVKVNYDSTMKDAYHYINHISCNKYDNDSFIFFHLWQKSWKRYSRAIFYNLKNNSFKVINKGKMVSHYDWESQNKILIYSEENGVNGFHLYDISNWTFKVVWQDVLFEDWHPTYFLGKNKILLDTYPDKDNLQSLYIYNSLNNSINNIVKILHKPYLLEEYRTDLHPRLSNNYKKVCIDTNIDWKRKILLINLN